ncbi:hypothetical protein ACFST9_11870 [Hymenobacter monticola]|uniref:Lipoprotein n=1 Tax=Hymenobacter monticola TaxID=1705399 RepID=A0ABY4BEP0_9BACT|nr:hypothetical protein [Hymenobacter monticola]UOE35110.1 hypothetical protein MTP16_05540 [Hymenobacter monticola]
MTKHLPAALALAALLGLSHCRRNDPAPAPPDPLAQLPAETQTGKGTFGCLLNGKAWTQAGSPFAGPLLNAQYFSQQLTVSANRSTTVDGVRTVQGIQINIDKINSIGRYTLADSTKDFINIVDLVTACTYYTDKAHPATVEITRLDPVARIVSGRFAFTLETPGCGKITATDGRFDCRF